MGLDNYMQNPIKKQQAVESETKAHWNWVVVVYFWHIQFLKFQPPRKLETEKFMAADTDSWCMEKCDDSVHWFGVIGC